METRERPATPFEPVETLDFVSRLGATELLSGEQVVGRLSWKPLRWRIDAEAGGRRWQYRLPFLWNFRSWFRIVDADTGSEIGRCRRIGERDERLELADGRVYGFDKARGSRTLVARDGTPILRIRSRGGSLRRSWSVELGPSELQREDVLPLALVGSWLALQAGNAQHAADSVWVSIT